MRSIRFHGLSRRVLIAIFVITLGFSFQFAGKVLASAPPGLVTFNLASSSCTSATIDGHNNDGSTFHADDGNAYDLTTPPLINGTSLNGVLPNNDFSFTISFLHAATTGDQIHIYAFSDTGDSADFFYTASGAGCLTPPVGTSSPTTVVIGPFIPANFVLRTITCNTPAYTTASGIPVITGEYITAGQTWFVNPTPVIIGKTSWTEFFDAGFIDAFIPTACVGGKPAGYLGA